MDITKIKSNIELTCSQLHNETKKLLKIFYNKIDKSYEQANLVSCNSYHPIVENINFKTEYNIYKNSDNKYFIGETVIISISLILLLASCIKLFLINKNSLI